jgi:hypothetical protein
MSSDPHTPNRIARIAFRIAVPMLILVLTACRGNEVLPEGGNPIPTPRVGDVVDNSPDSQAAATPEETFSRYIRDSIAATVAVQQTKINMRGRYQNPDQTLQDLGGLVSEISVLTDRTQIKTPKDTAANAKVDLDVRVKYADGDSQTFTCKYDVALQRGANTQGDNVWYIINPDAFPLFVSCVRS